MTISPLHPMHDVAAIPLAQSQGAAAERAAHAIDTHARLQDGQRRSAAAAQIDSTSGDNSVPDDRETSERLPWRLRERSASSVADAADGESIDSALGGGLDLTV